MTIEDDLQQLGAVIRKLHPRVCVGSDPECTLFLERGSAGGGDDTPGPSPPPPVAGCVCEQGTLTSPAGTTGVQTYPHSLGQAPKAIVMWSTGQSGDGVQANLLMSIGFATSSTNRATVAGNYPNGGSDLTENRFHDNTGVIVTTSMTPAVVEKADLDAFTAANFSLDWETVGAPQLQYHYLLIAGDGIEANVVQMIAQTVDATAQSVAHGMTTPPTALLMMSTHGLEAPPGFDTTPAETGISAGASDLTTDRFGGIFGSGGGARAQTANFLSHAQAAEPVVEKATVTSVDATNINLLWSIADSPEYYYFLCLSGCSVKVGTFNSPASPATVPVNTGLSSVSGFLTWGIGFPTTALVEDDAFITYGASDGANNACCGAMLDLFDADADRFDSSTKCLQVIDFAGAELEAATATFSGGDVSVIFSAAVAAANEFNYLAIE